VLRFEQVGPNVVLTGSGSAKLAALTFYRTETAFTNLLTDTEAYAGPYENGTGRVNVYSGLTGPLQFGSDPDVLELPTLASNGDLFGIRANDGMGQSLLVVPEGYSSGSSLSGTSIFASITLADLGLTLG
jgi:hypothetical protein